jgi:AraC-like DNA-binding protein
MIDPALARDPFPSSAVMIYAIPVHEKPYRLLPKATAHVDGRFSIENSSRSINNYSQVRRASGKGYTIEFAVPWSSFGSSLPQSVGCNVAVNVLDDQGRIHKLAWADAPGDNILYSPFIWGVVNRQAKPSFARKLILFLSSLLAGFVLGLVLMLTISIARQHHAGNSGKGTERQQETMRRINEVMEDELTNTATSAETVSAQLGLPVRLVNTTVRRFQGESFQSALMRGRVEIVKERLRSSHSSESAIAESCGFRSMQEMAKYFRKYSGTTPEEFRDKYQVT